MAAGHHQLMASAAKLVLATLLAVAGCRGFHGEEETTHRRSRVDASGRVALSPAEISALGLQSERAVAGKITAGRTRFGKVLARPGDDVLITAPLQARLLGVQVSLGQEVEQGVALAILEPSVDAVGRADLTARRNAIRAQLTGARARLHAAEVELQRLSTLVESGLATPSARARAEAEVASERAQTEGLGRSERTLRSYTGGQLTLAAPSAGVVVELEVSIGELLRQGDRVVRLLRPGARWVDVAVPPDDPVGTSYRIEACGHRVRASLVARGQTVQDGMRRDRLAVEAAPARCLAPGRVVTVAVGNEISGVVVPLSAVVRRGAERVVFVEAHPGLYVPRVVGLAGDDGQRAAVAAGISPDQRVVVVGAAELLGETGFSRRAQPPSASAPTRPSGAGGAHE